ncbi:MAG TPA: alpha/beta hydrolase [Phototrophicaceae bacterium]|nr:alpha/beta hydrolase [Phototrophicaceae bacterium]
MTTTAYHPFRSAEAQAEYLAQYEAAAQAWPIPSECQMVDTLYGQTFVRISGPVDAPPLVLLPGAGTCSLMWSLNVEALSTNHRTYAVDGLINTGCVGRSVYTRAITGPNDANTWLDALFDGLGLMAKVNLVGPSYGGWLASQYALHAPERLNKVVLVAPAGTLLPFSGEYLQRTMALYLTPSRDTYVNVFKWNFSDLARQNETLLEALVDDFLLSARCFESPNPQALPVLTALSDAELQRFSVPTLVLIGENEVLYSAQAALQRLQAVAPQIRTELIPNAGHDLLLVQTELVNQKLLAFLAAD